jgi:hypothetical protein
LLVFRPTPNASRSRPVSLPNIRHLQFSGHSGLEEDRC